jgi:mannose-1-phosphate guanylyltransferase
MKISHKTWAIVLAGGEGTRLHGLTTDASGVAVPKQYCSLAGGQSLLIDTLQRAASVVEPSYICVVVAAQHRRWWEPICSRMPKSRIIVQPRNCGTGNGVLLPLLHILARDHDAHIVLLPSDHYVRDEPALASSLRQAVGALEDHPDEVLVLGMQKPSGAAARQLLDQGALWNALIMATRARALLDLFMLRQPDVVAKMHFAVGDDLRSSTNALAATFVYRDLPNIDFSSQILQGSETKLRLIKANRCGWTDLGTPKRLCETLRKMPHVGQTPQETTNSVFAPMNLSAQHARLGGTIRFLRDDAFRMKG